MPCTDVEIIKLILEPGGKPELEAFNCLMKCRKPSIGLLKRMGLVDEKEGKSIFLHAVAEFIIKVRQQKFVLSGAAKICTYITEVSRRQWLKQLRKTKEVVPERPNEKTEEELERDEMLQEAMLKLKVADREILTDFYFYGYSQIEIGKKNGITHDAAKQRIRRARQHLKEILKNNMK